MGQKYKIEHIRDECIGCGACSSVAPEYWKMEDDGKTSINGAEKTKNDAGQTIEKLGPTEEGFELNNDAAESCPVNCIHLFKINEDNSEEKVI